MERVGFKEWALVRVLRLATPWRFADSPRYFGCHSWGDLPELPAGLEMLPIVNEEEQARRRESFRAALI